MIIKTGKLFALALFLLVFGYNAQAQAPKKELLEQLKNGNTHVVVDTTEFPDAGEFLKVFKENWKLTKSVSYLNRSHLDDSLIVNDYYFSLELETFTVGNGGYVTTFYFILWTPNKKILNKKKPFLMRDRQDIYSFLISADRAAVDPSFSRGPRPIRTKLGYNFSGEGHFFNWDAGHLKNYLQRLTTYFETGEDGSFFDDFNLKSELKELKKDTLFITSDAFVKKGTFTRDGKFIDTAGLFNDYKFLHKVITPVELKERILKATEPFYYFVAVTNASKMVGVINGKTGRVVYSRFHNFSRNLNDGDLKELSKTIERSEK